jgi:hypothetical protein
MLEKFFLYYLGNSITKYVNDFKINISKKLDVKSDDKKLDQILSDEIDKFRW